MPASKEDTVGELVAERPERARVFERLGIDYCCGGKQTLAAACAQLGLSPETVLAQLESAAASSVAAGEAAPASLTLTALCEQIVQLHHAYLRETLPRLHELARKVTTVHRPAHPELEQVREVFEELWMEIENHIDQEERLLFPACRQLEATLRPVDLSCGSLGAAVVRLEHEHSDAGEALTLLRSLTDGYGPPPDACPSYRSLLEGLHDLESDLHQHIHKENNILFLRAMALDAALRGSGAGPSR